MKLYEKISDDLRSSIIGGRLDSGHRLPSLGELQGRYHVSHITALHAYRLLEAENLVECHQGQGYFVKSPAGAPSRITGRFGCFTRTMRPPSPVDNFSNEINIGIQTGSVNQGLDLILSRHTQLNTPVLSPELSRTLEEKMLSLSESVDGFLLDERIPDSLIQRVQAKTSIPMVMINRRSSLPVNMVYPDNAAALQSILDYGRKLGYTQFIFCAQSAVGQYPEINYNHRRRHELFMECADSASSEIVENGLVIPVADFLEAVRKTFRRRKNPGRILLICTTGYLAGLIFRNRETLFSGHDLPGLASLDGNGLQFQEQTVITHMQNDAMGMGLKAVELLLQSVTGSGSYLPETARISSIFVPGNTMN